MKNLLLIMTGFILILFILFFIPYPFHSSAKIITINKDMNGRQIANLLKKEGLIWHEFCFELLTRLSFSQKKLKAGCYRIDPALSAFQILKLLREEKSSSYRVTICEGYNSYQIANLLVTQGLIQDKQRFLKLIQDKDFILELGLEEEVEQLEGYLFPETYFFAPGTKEEVVLKVMVNECRKRVLENKIYQSQRQFLGLTWHEILTLASLIEKEARIEKERPLISSVFHNRLKEGIPLESDPTVIYALGERFNGNLTREDLNIDSSYNTYRYQGLPPTPICNPGQKSIEAALYPSHVDYLYFVARGDGTHQFSSNGEEHHQNVIKYQIEHGRR